jgi:hypothetical protein
MTILRVFKLTFSIGKRIALADFALSRRPASIFLVSLCTFRDTYLIQNISFGSRNYLEKTSPDQRFCASQFLLRSSLSNRPH